MVERSAKLSQVEVVSVSTMGEALFADPAYRDSFFTNSLFVSQNVREAVNSGRGDYVPVFLSEIPLLFKRGVLPIDVALFKSLLRINMAMYRWVSQ